MPFLIEKVLEMLYHIIKPRPGENFSYQNSEHLNKLYEESEKANRMKSKLKAVAKLMQMYREMREDKEEIIRFQGLCPDNKIPRGLLIGGTRAIKDAIGAFSRAKEHDLVNEMIPNSRK